MRYYITTSTTGLIPNPNVVYKSKSPSKFKVMLFSVKWHWKNRRWKICRQKKRAFERALKKERLSL